MEIKEAINLGDDFYFKKRRKGPQPLYYWKKPNKQKKKNLPKRSNLL
jgi:hypothetical protein